MKFPQHLSTYCGLGLTLNSRQLITQLRLFEWKKIVREISATDLLIVSELRNIHALIAKCQLNVLGTILTTRAGPDVATRSRGRGAQTVACLHACDAQPSHGMSEGAVS
jgi:hypothetical protein